MNRVMLKAKVHRATVTETDVDYEGSLTLDESLMKAAGMIPFEQVHVYNISNGERFTTYLIKGEKDSGIVGVNGAAAHKANVRDKLIIATYVMMDDKETDFFIPKILIVDENNKIKDLEKSFSVKADEFDSVLKSGRTHLEKMTEPGIPGHKSRKKIDKEKGRQDS